jgi:hypothetical protein
MNSDRVKEAKINLALLQFALLIMQHNCRPSPDELENLVKQQGKLLKIELDKNKD